MSRVDALHALIVPRPQPYLCCVQNTPMPMNTLIHHMDGVYTTFGSRCTCFNPTRPTELTEWQPDNSLFSV